MRYRIAGAWRESGQEAILEVEASDPRRAQELGNERGVLVSRVTPIGRGAAVAPRRGRARRRVDSRGLADLLLFRRMVTPWLIRAGFYMVTILTLVGVTLNLVRVVERRSAAGGGLLADASPWAPPPGSTGVMVYLWPILSGALVILVTRVIAEMFIVLFQISESLTDLRDDVRYRR